MPDVQLARLAYVPMGTFSRLTIPGHPWYRGCWTYEPPWDDNLPDVSCIPTGSYALELGVRHPGRADAAPAFFVRNVPGRSDIEFHVGDDIHDTLGCILLGNNLGCLTGLWAVLESTLAVRDFMQAMGATRAAQLVILNPPPPGLPPLASADPLA